MKAILSDWKPQYSRIAALAAIAALLVIRFAAESSAVPAAVVLLVTAVIAVSFAAMPLFFATLAAREERPALRAASMAAATTYPIYWIAIGAGEAFGGAGAVQLISYGAALAAGLAYAMLGIQLRRLDEVLGHKTRGYGFVFLFFGVVLAVGRLAGPFFATVFLAVVFLSDYVVIWIALAAAAMLLKPKDPPGLTPMRPLR